MSVDEKVKEGTLLAENNYPDQYNTLIYWLRKNQKKKNIYPLELTFAFSKQFNDELYILVDGNLDAFMDIFAQLSQGIIDNDDLKLKVINIWDKAPTKISKKYALDLARQSV